VSLAEVDSFLKAADQKRSRKIQLESRARLRKAFKQKSFPSDGDVELLNGDWFVVFRLGVSANTSGFIGPFQALGAARKLVVGYQGRHVLTAHQSRVRLHKRDPKGTALDRGGHFLSASRDTTWETPLQEREGERSEEVVSFLDDPCMADAKKTSEAIDLLDTCDVSEVSPSQPLQLKAVGELADDAEAQNFDDTLLGDEVLENVTISPPISLLEPLPALPLILEDVSLDHHDRPRKRNHSDVSVAPDRAAALKDVVLPSSEYVKWPLVALDAVDLPQLAVVHSGLSEALVGAAVLDDVVLPGAESVPRQSVVRDAVDLTQIAVEGQDDAPAPSREDSQRIISLMS
jgi:hypothetical protein